MKKIALLDECLVELNGIPFNSLQQTYGGDSLNTAVYLARLARGAIEVNYVTALGVDALSNGMIERWSSEGINTGMVLRDAQRLPGMYLIQVDAHGERTFLYWRGDSAARYLMRHPNFETIRRRLEQMDTVFVTGISLAILPPDDRAKLIDLLSQLAANGVSIIFDTNYRSRLWASAHDAQTTAARLFPSATITFATFDDEHQLWGDNAPGTTISRLLADGARCVVLKNGAEGCTVAGVDFVKAIPTNPVQRVVDSTAACDAFNAAFLAEWLNGQSLERCCRAGNLLAGVVIQHRGAIIPALSMPTMETLDN
jgi:2-dehydro-3-deoxygluconokinase